MSNWHDYRIRYLVPSKHGEPTERFSAIYCGAPIEVVQERVVQITQHFASHGITVDPLIEGRKVTPWRTLPASAQRSLSAPKSSSPSGGAVQEQQT